MFFAFSLSSSSSSLFLLHNVAPLIAVRTGIVEFSTAAASPAGTAGRKRVRGRALVTQRVALCVAADVGVVGHHARVDSSGEAAWRSRDGLDDWTAVGVYLDGLARGHGVVGSIDGLLRLLRVHSCGAKV